MVIRLRSPLVKFVHVVYTASSPLICILFLIGGVKGNHLAYAIAGMLILYIFISIWAYENNIETEIDETTITCVHKMGPIASKSTFLISEIK